MDCHGSFGAHRKIALASLTTPFMTGPPFVARVPCGVAGRHKASVVCLTAPNMVGPPLDLLKRLHCVAHCTEFRGSIILDLFFAFLGLHVVFSWQFNYQKMIYSGNHLKQMCLLDI